MKILKIGIVCYPSIGGSGIVATNLGMELAKLGHQIHFISYDKPFRANLKSPNVFFHRVSINKYDLFKYPDYTLPLAVTIGNVNEKFRLDIVHVHYAVPHATAALLSNQMLGYCDCENPKIITTLHGTDITLLAQDQNLFSIIKYSIEASDGVTAVSQSLKDDTIKTLKTKTPVEVIYNFYAPAKTKASRERVRSAIKIKPDDFLGIHLSNLRPVKRIPDLLKIVGLMVAKPKFKLLILAGGDFSPYLPLVKKLGIKNQLIIKQNEFEIGDYINAADVGIYTSQEESFGMGMLETMSYGKPALATRSGGIPEVLRDVKDGYLLPVGDVKGFAKKIMLLMDDTKLYSKLARNALLRSQSDFSAKKIVQKYLDYYQKILNT